MLRDKVVQFAKEILKYTKKISVGECIIGYTLIVGTRWVFTKNQDPPCPQFLSKIRPYDDSFIFCGYWSIKIWTVKTAQGLSHQGLKCQSDSTTFAVGGTINTESLEATILLTWLKQFHIWFEHRNKINQGLSFDRYSRLIGDIKLTHLAQTIYLLNATSLLLTLDSLLTVSSNFWSARDMSDQKVLTFNYMTQHKVKPVDLNCLHRTS